MAEVRLHHSEVDDGELPRVCMVCGQRAEDYRKKKFQWHPPWVIVLLLLGLVPFAIVALVLTKRMTVWAPLCREHRNHWTWRGWFIGLGFTRFIVGGIAAFAVVVGGPPGQADANAGLLCAAPALLFLVFLVVAVIVQFTSIRPNEITSDEITLKNVSPEFIDALEEEEERWREEQRQRKARRRERGNDVAEGRDRDERFAEPPRRREQDDLDDDDDRDERVQDRPRRP